MGGGRDGEFINQSAFSDDVQKLFFEDKYHVFELRDSLSKLGCTTAFEKVDSLVQHIEGHESLQRTLYAINEIYDERNLVTIAAEN